MILGWPAVEKTPQDVLTVALDWTPFISLTQGATSITAHSVSVDAQVIGAQGWGDFDFITVGSANVIAIDNGVTGFVQSVTLSQGLLLAYSIVALTVTFDDGTQLTRCFQVNVR